MALCDEAGVVVLVSVLKRRASVELSHGHLLHLVAGYSCVPGSSQVTGQDVLYPLPGYLLWVAGQVCGLR
jgi:hypothetical protein